MQELLISPPTFDIAVLIVILIVTTGVLMTLARRKK